MVRVLTEVIAANLFAKHATLTLMSTLIIDIPTLDANHVMSYDMAYHYQHLILKV